MEKSKTKQSKYFANTIRIVLIGILVSSCTVLQWRENDEEIFNNFENTNIQNEISYHTIDSLHATIRVQNIFLGKEKPLNLVFLHGSPASSSAWFNYVKDSTLLHRANIVLIDRPGYGYSNFGKEIPEIDKQAKIINEVLAKLALENRIVIGASYGGAIAALQASYSNRVRGVIMISPAIDPTIEKDIWGARFTQWWLTRWLVPTAYRVAGDEKVIHASELSEIENKWPSISIPVYHVHGDADDLVPYENIHYTEKVFQQHKIFTIPNTGHEISWSRPDVITPVLHEMIDVLQ